MPKQTNRTVAEIVKSTRAHKIIHNKPYDDTTTTHHKVLTNKQGFSIFPTFTREELTDISVKILDSLKNK